jgi:hypothetical protein
VTAWGDVTTTWPFAWHDDRLDAMAVRYRGPAFVAHLVYTATWEADRVVTSPGGTCTSTRAERAKAGPRWSTPGAYDERLAEFDERASQLDERDHQLEQRMAELRDKLATVERETVSAAEVQRAVALFDLVWDLLLVPELFASCTYSSSPRSTTAPPASSS